MRLLPLMIAAVMALAPGMALAKARPAATPKPGQLTQTDLRTCMGLNGSKPTEQITACTKIINSGNVKHPFEGDYYATRGAAYLANRQPDKALLDTNKAISVRKAPEFYLQRGIIDMALHRAQDAKADFAEVIRLKPELAQTYLLRGLVSYQEGNFPEAITYFEDAAQRKPKFYQAIFARGVAKKRNGDASGDADIAEARGMSTQVDADLSRFGVTP
jgi:tetratricopeptide (TPR) repeat protein